MIHLKRRFRIGFPTATIWLVVISWAGLAGLVILTDPEIFTGYRHLPVWPLIWLSLVSTIKLISGSLTPGLLYGTAAVLYLFLRYLGIGYWIYAVLLFSLAVSANWYLKRF